MAIKSYFFNAVLSDGVYDRIYNAEDFTSYLDLLVGNGVFPNPSTNLQVRAGSGMNVIVGAGSGWINGHKIINTADLTLAVDESDVLLNRIDAVVFYVDADNRTMGIGIKKGTLAATPTAPSMQRDSSKFELCLAQISVPKQVVSITAAMITDTRGNSDLCGIVQGLIQQVSTTTLFAQWQAAFEAWFAGIQQQFSEGNMFQQYEGIYTTQTANVTTFNVKTYVPYFNYATDVLDVYVNGIHKNTNEFTLNNNNVIMHTGLPLGSVVTFVVLKLVDLTNS